MLIMGVLGTAVLSVVILSLYDLHLTLPNGGTTTGLDIRSFLELREVRVTLASLLAFAADMFVIVIVYQGTKNVVPNVPEWIVVGIALLAGLWIDAILFSTLANLGTEDFRANLPGDVFGKTFSALLLWPIVAYYIIAIAPKIKGHVGTKNRKTFELLFGSFEEVKLALIRTEQALEESEVQRKREAEYFRQISDNIQEGLWLTQPNQLSAIYVNKAYVTLWGRSAESLLAEEYAFVESIHPEDRERILAGLPKQFEGNYEVEYRIIRPDGAVRWVRDRAFPIYDEQGNVYRMAGISEDITARKELEQQELELMLERDRVKLLHDFINEASHDLKTPLAAINMKVYHISRATDPDKRQEHLRDLEMLSNRMGRMIDDLFTLARLENTGEIANGVTDVNLIVRGICDGVRPITDDKHIKLECLPCEGELLANTNKADLERALANLVDNAVRYTPDDGTVSIQTRHENDQIIIQISDSGIGISADDQRRIFERFFRADNARNTDPNGTGLGLAITQKIIEYHHGHIEVSSIPEKGTTFTIILPLADTTKSE
jgi:PAS domain S-box-containing protein